MWPFTERKPYINSYRVILPSCEELQAKIEANRKEAERMNDLLKASASQADQKIYLAKIQMLEERSRDYLNQSKGLARAADLINAALG